MKIVVTGASGFVGQGLCKRLVDDGHVVMAVDLRKGPVLAICSECDAIIHLAGAPIAHRWTTSYKQLILESRVKTSQAIWNFLETTKRRLL